MDPQEITIHFHEGAFYSAGSKLTEKRASWYWENTGNMEVLSAPVFWTQSAYLEMSRRVLEAPAASSL